MPPELEADLDPLDSPRIWRDAVFEQWAGVLSGGRAVSPRACTELGGAMRRRAVRWSRAVCQNVGAKRAPPRQPAVVDGDESGAGPDEHPAELHPDSAAEERVRFSRPYCDVVLGDPKPPRSSPHPLTPATRLREPTGPPPGPQLRPEHTLPFATTGPEIPPTVALPVVGQDGRARPPEEPYI